MEERQALGLAANQLGYSCRVLVMSMEPMPPICIVNPQVTKQKGSQLSTEYCLSVPEEKVVIKRPYVVVVRGVNQYFRPVRYRLRGLQARVASHELDHLEGVLITDYENR
ncbi:Peptide deformylase [subsurface metagenome]